MQTMENWIVELVDSGKNYSWRIPDILKDTTQTNWAVERKKVSSSLIIANEVLHKKNRVWI